MLLALFLIAVEGLAYWAGNLLTRVGVFYVPEHAPEFEDAYPYDDAHLGWPPGITPDDPLRDRFGARHSPDGPTNGTQCISFFGESLAFGNDVSDREVWTHLFSESLDCRVANFAVGGFGTDQTLLRYLRLTSDRAPIVVFGMMPSGVIRSVNQWRPLTAPGTPRSMKPRFVVEAGGRLRLVPLREFDAEGYAAARERPEDYFDAEFFAPNGPSGIRRLRFPYMLSLLGARYHWNLSAHFRGLPGHYDFYRPDHPAGGLELTARILEAFRNEAQARGQHPIVLILANLQDFEYRQETGRWPYAPLIDRLMALGVDSIELGEALLKAPGNVEIGSLYLADSPGHLSPEGHVEAVRALTPMLRGSLASLSRASKVPPSGPKEQGDSSHRSSE